MGDNQRHKRLRLLLKELNKERKMQAKKIDILCNDLIGAQREFIRKLKTISFTAGFYESIIGITDLNNLLYTAVKLIEGQSPDAGIAFFLRRGESLELHVFEKSHRPILDKEQLETRLTPELINNACKANRVCTLDEIFEMGPDGNPTGLDGTSAVTIPLGRFGASFGFMLVYRNSQNKLTCEEIQNISAVVPGLSQAIASCQAHSHAAS
ncbi:MAG: hypothetical protein JSW59_00135 [Phycisphaerales bacterium]|nr:MAG: hypothetical protein JSW59_00135 [Phycisphaerales bacterium]